jgi:hypothetical protein
MFEIEMAFGARDYERDLLPEWRAYTDGAFPGPEPPRRRIRLFKTSFGAAFALATAAFWFTGNRSTQDRGFVTKTSDE